MMLNQELGTKPFGGVVSKPIEASPVQSNTTLKHDRLGGVVQRALLTDEVYPLTLKGETNA